jgi:phage repressor protein C with HTH and peptisase S24 domain
MSSANLMNFTVIVERMKQASGLANESAIAKALDISPQAMSNFKNKGKIPSDQVIQFALKFKLSVDWLLTGEGASRWGEQPRFSLGHVSEDRALYGDDFVMIPRMTGDISAGGGLVPDDSVEMKVAFRKDWICRHGDPKNMSLIRVSGDSMYPTLLSGDLILVDHGRNYVDPHGGLYAISMDHSIMIKRIQIMHATGKLRIISDNIRYEAIDAEPGQVKVTGKVIWFGRELER